MAQKTFEKDGRTKTATTRRQEVELRFAGYREVVTSEEAAANDQWETNGGTVAVDEAPKTKPAK